MRVVDHGAAETHACVTGAARTNPAHQVRAGEVRSPVDQVHRLKLHIEVIQPLRNEPFHEPQAAARLIDPLGMPTPCMGWPNSSICI